IRGLAAPARLRRGVVAEAAARLAAQVTGRHQVLEQRRGGEARLAELQVELALYGQGDVEADHVQPPERAHRVDAAALNRGVAAVGGDVVRLENIASVVAVRTNQGIDD